MNNINRLPSASPAVSGDAQQHLDADQIRAIALRVGTGGDLHPFLPDWCRTIGDDVNATLRRGEAVSPTDTERLLYALGCAEAREGASVRKREPKSGQPKSGRPKSGQTLSWRRIVDATGTGQWEAEVIPLHRATRFPTVGSA